MNNTKERKKWVDVLRAIAMILVVYGHRSSGWTEYFVFTSPIKIPLFFAVTGYVFNDANGNFTVFIKKLWRTIIVPWLVIACLPYLMASPIKGIGFLKENLISVLTGANYWYMPCCIAAEILWFWILKYVKPIWLVGLITGMTFAAGMAMYANSMLSVFMINRAMTAQVFLFIGRLLRKYEENIAHYLNRVPVLIGGTAVYILLAVLTMRLYPGHCLDVHLCRYYNIPLCGAMIWIGIYVLAVLISRRITYHPRLLSLIGQHTLVIYLMHQYLLRVFEKGFFILHIPFNKFTNVFLTLFVCLAGAAISLAINRFVPELMGKRRTRSHK